MEKKIKLIWDFRNRDVEHFAEHHAKHLKEFLEKENYEFVHTGIELIHEHHAIAYMVVDEKDMLRFRDALKPHRAAYYKA
ncbi:hypothetical protein GO491_05315 [Flavobacteriaceae bacterium Ap0902]|nr:hypothetical protein [Flavobacteriaceae bacterium Ap0902]